MAVLGSLICGVLLVLISSTRTIESTHVCIRYHIQDQMPCVLMRQVAREAAIAVQVFSETDNSFEAYCNEACSQEYNYMFEHMCPCNVTRPCTTSDGEQIACENAQGVCKYSHIRADAGLGRGKRINEGKPAKHCEYPGIVGVFQNAGKRDQSSICTGVLIDESHILVSKTCENLLRDGMVIHVNSYDVSDVTTDIKVDISKAQQVSVLATNELFMVGLRKDVTYDTECALPACLPSSSFKTSDIDFDNCRVVGYGMTMNGYTGKQPDVLQEVEVSVNRNSINSEHGLEVTRKDGSVNSNVACFNDDSAPVMCAHKETNEWIVVGLYTTPGFPCSNAKYVSPLVANVLEENPTFEYHEVLSAL